MLGNPKKLRHLALAGVAMVVGVVLTCFTGCAGGSQPSGSAGSQTPSTHDIGGAGVPPVIGSAALRGGDSEDGGPEARPTDILEGGRLWPPFPPAYPAFPGEGDGPYSAVRAVSDSVLVVNGNALVEEHGVNNKPGEGNAYVIAPGGDDDLAWARYSIEGLTVERPVDISIGVTGVIAPGGDDDLPISYWLGLSDYTNYRWEWRGDPLDPEGGPYTASAQLVLNSNEVRERYVSAAGVFHFVILTESSSVEPDEDTNPEGITSVEIVASTMAAKDATAPDYKPTAPHYTLIESISLGGEAQAQDQARARLPSTPTRSTSPSPGSISRTSPTRTTRRSATRCSGNWWVTIKRCC
ncbi:hypothetical protein IIA79_01335 [bacterium]|nr:hypothetical protein [bacterium]